MAARLVDGGVDDGPNTFAIGGGFPTPRLGDGINNVQTSPSNVGWKDRNAGWRFRAAVSHLQPEAIIAVLHLNRAACSGVNHRVRHQFREHEHDIINRAATTLIEPTPCGASCDAHRCEVVIEGQRHHVTTRPINKLGFRRRPLKRR